MDRDQLHTKLAAAEKERDRLKDIARRNANEAELTGAENVRKLTTIQELRTQLEAAKAKARDVEWKAAYLKIERDCARNVLTTAEATAREAMGLLSEVEDTGIRTTQGRILVGFSLSTEQWAALAALRARVPAESGETVMKAKRADLTEGLPDVVELVEDSAESGETPEKVEEWATWINDWNEIERQENADWLRDRCHELLTEIRRIKTVVAEDPTPRQPACETCGDTKQSPPIKYPGVTFTPPCPDCVCRDCGGSGRETEEDASIPDGDGVADYYTLDLGPCPTCTQGEPQGDSLSRSVIPGTVERFRLDSERGTLPSDPNGQLCWYGDLVDWKAKAAAWKALCMEIEPCGLLVPKAVGKGEEIVRVLTASGDFNDAVTDWLDRRALKSGQPAEGGDA